jgi:hypothetical protein
VSLVVVVGMDWLLGSPDQVITVTEGPRANEGENSND